MIPSRHAAVERVTPEHLLERVLPPPRVPLTPFSRGEGPFVPVGAECLDKITLVAAAKERGKSHWMKLVLTRFAERGVGAMIFDLNAEYAAECLLRACGVRVEYVFQTFAGGTAGETHKTLDGLVDALYVIKVTENTPALMNAMFDSDFVCGYIPFGYAKRFNTTDGTRTGEGVCPRQMPIPHPESASVVPAAYAVMRQTRQIARVREYLHRVTNRGGRRIKSSLCSRTNGTPGWRSSVTDAGRERRPRSWTGGSSTRCSRFW